MIIWIASATAVVAAYLLGSIPAAYLAGQILRGIDIREYGSRSVGATNTLRVLGKGPALVVFLIDVFKGTASVLLARALVFWALYSPPLPSDQANLAAWISSLAGMAAIFGHGRSIWLGFSGGKSVATGLGVVLAMSWPVALGALAVFSLAIAAMRIVSLGSILAAITAAALVVVLDNPLSVRMLVVVGAVYVVARHHANIKRLSNGTEPRLGRT